MFHSKPDEKEQLLSEVRQRIAVLEEAISQISRTKKHLKENALEVKSQIHKTISRQLETLRNREVFLLNQVEVIQLAKEDVLRKQEDQLNQALGGLQNSLEYSDDDTLSISSRDGGLCKKLSDSIERLDHLELRPEESPHICFRTDVAFLREAIMNFGRVDANGLHIPGGIADGGYSSTSLPKVFEDYGDAEHHVLYKTLEEIKRKKENDTSIHVNIPKLSMRKEDWLVYPGESSTDCTETDYTFPPFQSKQARGTVGHRDACHMSTSSIQHWLQQIKHDVEVEEDDYEFVYSAGCHSAPSDISGSVEVISKGESNNLSGNYSCTGYFKKVTTMPSDTWILTTDRIRAAYNFGPTYPYETMKYFREVGKSTKEWLMEYANEQDCCGKGSCSLPPSKEPVDIENLDSLTCVHDVKEAVSKYFREIHTDKRTWVKAAQPVDEDMDTDDSEDSAVMGVGKVCKANEPCNSFSECVADENCCVKLAALSLSNQDLQKASSQSVPSEDLHQWLMISQINKEVLQTSPLFSYLQFMSNSIEDWLLTDNKEHVADDSASVFPLFSTICSSGSSQWLNYAGSQKQELVEDNAPLFPPFQDTKDFTTGWLQGSFSPSPMKADKEKCIIENSKETTSEKALPIEAKKSSSVDSQCVHGASLEKVQKKARELNWLLKQDVDQPPVSKPCEDLTGKMFDAYFTNIHKYCWLPGGSKGENWLAKDSSTEKPVSIQPEKLSDLFATTNMNMKEWLLNHNM